MRYSLLSLVFIGSFCLTACAPAPQASADLSEKIGTQIAHNHTAYVHVIRSYFADKKQTLQDYTNLEIKNYLDNLETTAKAQGKKFSIDAKGLNQVAATIEKLQDQSHAEMARLNAIEQQVLDHADANYANLSRANVSLTEYLRSVSDIHSSMANILLQTKKLAPNLPAAGPAAKPKKLLSHGE